MRVVGTKEKVVKLFLMSNDEFRDKNVVRRLRTESLLTATAQDVFVRVYKARSV